MIFDLFVKRKWSKYAHVMFAEDFRAGVSTYEILKRECELTGLTQYKRVYVSKCTHNLDTMLTNWFKSLTPSVIEVQKID